MEKLQSPKPTVAKHFWNLQKKALKFTLFLSHLWFKIEIHQCTNNITKTIVFIHIIKHRHFLGVMCECFQRLGGAGKCIDDLLKYHFVFLTMFGFVQVNKSNTSKWCFEKSTMNVLDPPQSRKHPHVTPKKCLYIKKNKFLEYIVGTLVSCLPSTKQWFLYIRLPRTVRKMSSFRVQQLYVLEIMANN